MSVSDAANSIKSEAASIAESLRIQLSTLDFSLDDLNTLLGKYNLMSQSVLGLSYTRLLESRALPPVDPDVLFDQQRASLVDLVSIGDVFFPAAPSSNLRSLQALYLNLGESLGRVSAELNSHPPTDSAAAVFSAAINRFEVTTVASTAQSGLKRSREDVAQEIGRETFELFSFPDVPQLYFVISPVFEGVNASLTVLGRRLGLRPDQLSVSVFWYGNINASAFNFAKMRTSLALSPAQMRVASFGDDLATSSSSLFLGLLDRMEAEFSFSNSSLEDSSRLLEIVDAMLRDAQTFLAQITFATFVIEDDRVLEDLREGGASDGSIEFSFQRRSDQLFQGANLYANKLKTTVFPTTDNSAQIRAMGKALQQDPDTFRFTNTALNVPEDLRGTVVTASKRLVASLVARQQVLQRPTTSALLRDQALAGIQSDLGSLRAAYEEFLNPTGEDSREAGTKTTETANNLLGRSSNFISALRILDQIDEFPGPVGADLETILGALRSIAGSQNAYLAGYRSGPIRDFLAEAVSISSVTGFLLAGGIPENSQIVVETPELIANLRRAIQEVILDDEESEELYDRVSLQVEEFAAVLRGNEEDDPVGRLFSLPVMVIESLLSSGLLELESEQEQSLTQLRDSFEALETIRSATVRDLEAYSSSFSNAHTDARFFNSRLAGDSVSDLIAELR